ncbi:HSPC139 [Culex quinquefasciatus]|uniref:Cysteine-rich PDZ-binding protein n=1 Tax=Culex quinquefasciatus TaxID=7176 RepID=B0XL46_CULQU|nr:HSPC139 [Culex quinquefasciatus]|eukprot:XP_001870368.1 HSPC139 [Culex quinquefasciatus]
MVCEKCEKKLGKVITPDPWKTGARNTTEGGGRKINENKALSSAKTRFNPIGPDLQAKDSPSRKSLLPAVRVQKGICAMCGKKLIDVKNYRQSST